MKYLGAIEQTWFLTCVVGALVAPIVPTHVAAGVILVGLMLVVRAKYQRYPAETWSTATRTYARSHHWPFTTRILGWMGAVWCVSLVVDRQPRGVYLACLGAYWLLFMARPIRAASVDVPVGS